MATCKICNKEVKKFHGKWDNKCRPCYLNWCGEQKLLPRACSTCNEKKNPDDYYNGNRWQQCKDCTINRRKARQEKNIFKKSKQLQNTFHTRLNIHIERKINSGYIAEDPDIEEKLGCSLPNFFQHIESLFAENMTWENTEITHMYITTKTPADDGYYKYQSFRPQLINL